MKVKFIPQNIELEIKPNQSVMDLAHKNNVFIKSICNGLPSCSECRVRLVEGEHNVLPPSTKETNLIGTGHFIDQRRLSCQLICFGDITVDLTEQIDKKADGPRRPQGSRKTETEVSHAVSGNLLDQEADLLKTALTPPPQERQPNRDQQPRRDNRGQNNNQRSGQNQPPRGPRQGQQNRGGGQGQRQNTSRGGQQGTPQNQGSAQQNNKNRR